MRDDTPIKNAARALHEYDTEALAFYHAIFRERRDRSPLWKMVIDNQELLAFYHHGERLHNFDVSRGY